MPRPEARTIISSFRRFSIWMESPSGELRILRSLEPVRTRIAEARMRLVLLWIFAVLAGIGLTYLLARRLLRPVAALDRAAAEIAEGNFDVRVPVEGSDEMAGSAETFNSMSASIQAGREELIRQERISTIGRLSTSIVHDLRNPLAAIYGGAEMLVDTDLSPEQVRRLAANIYRSSRQIQKPAARAGRRQPGPRPCARSLPPARSGRGGVRTSGRDRRISARFDPNRRAGRHWSFRWTAPPWNACFRT